MLLSDRAEWRDPPANANSLTCRQFRMSLRSRVRYGEPLASSCCTRAMAARAQRGAHMLRKVIGVVIAGVLLFIGAWTPLAARYGGDHKLFDIA